MANIIISALPLLGITELSTFIDYPVRYSKILRFPDEAYLPPDKQILSLLILPTVPISLKYVILISPKFIFLKGFSFGSYEKEYSYTPPRNRCKSKGAMSCEYGRWDRTSHSNVAHSVIMLENNFLVSCVVLDVQSMLASVLSIAVK